MAAHWMINFYILANLRRNTAGKCAATPYSQTLGAIASDNNMGTVRQLYDTEFKGDDIGPEGPLPLENADGTQPLTPVMWKILLSHNHRSAILVFYVPKELDVVACTRAVIDNHQWVLNIKNDLKISTGFKDEPLIDLGDCLFTNRLIVYVEHEISEEFENQASLHARDKGLALIIRDLKYLRRLENRNRPFAFISHDSRDKETIARKLATSLTQNLCPVWYDEFSLKVGDSLRDSIEKGIKECKKCISILTPNFLSNTGWTKKEFDSIFTRELIFQEKVILPIWAGVTKKDVYEYSPSLADTVALTWSDNDLEKNTRDLLKVLL